MLLKKVRPKTRKNIFLNFVPYFRETNINVQKPLWGDVTVS